MPSWKILRMATIEAADALGMAETIGSLKKGKKADLILVDLSEPHMNPLYEAPIRNLIPNLVYTARGHEAESVMIDGRFVMENRRILTAEEEEIIKRVNNGAERIAGKLRELPWAKELPLAKWTREGFY